MTVEPNLASFSSIEQNLAKLERAEAEGKYVIVHTNAGKVEVSTFDSFIYWAIQYFKSSSEPGKTYGNIKEAKQQALLGLNAQLLAKIKPLEKTASTGTVSEEDVQNVTKAIEVAVQIESALKKKGLSVSQNESPSETLSKVISEKITKAASELESEMKKVETAKAGGDKKKYIDAALAFTDKIDDLGKLEELQEKLGIPKSNQVAKPIIQEFQKTLKEHFKKNLEGQLQGDITKRSEARAKFNEFDELLGDDAIDLYLADAITTHSDELNMLDAQIEKVKKRLGVVQKELKELQSSQTVDLDTFLNREKSDVTENLYAFLEDPWPNPYQYVPGKNDPKKTLASLPDANSEDSYKVLLNEPARDLREIVLSTEEGDVKQVLIHQDWILKQLEICSKQLKQDRILRLNSKYKAYLKDLAACASTIISFNRTCFTDNLRKASTTPVKVILKEYNKLYQQLEQFDRIKGNDYSELTKRNGYLIEKALNDHLESLGGLLDALFWKDPQNPTFRALKKALAFKQPPEPKELQEVLENVQKTIKEFADKGITPGSARKAKKTDPVQKTIKEEREIKKEFAELQSKRAACEKALIALPDAIESDNSATIMKGVTIAEKSTGAYFQKRAELAKQLQNELQLALKQLTDVSNADLVSRFKAVQELEVVQEKLKKLQADMNEIPKSRRDKAPEPSLAEFERAFSAFKSQVEKDIKEREALSYQLAQGVYKVEKEMATVEKSPPTIKGLQEACVKQNVVMDDLLKLHKQLAAIPNPKPEKPDPSLQPTINNFHGMQKKLLGASLNVLTQQLEKVANAIRSIEDITKKNEIDLQLIQVNLDKANLQSKLKILMDIAKQRKTLDRQKLQDLEILENRLKEKEENLIKQQKELLASVAQPANPASVQKELNELQDQKVKLMGTIELINAQLMEIDRLKPDVIRDMKHINGVVNAAAAAA
jgi:hypothetical protein